MIYAADGFAGCLSRIMEIRGLSAGELTEMLGLGSKTTVMRILHGSAGERSIMNFRNLLVGSTALALSAEEVQKLNDSVSSQKKETSHHFVFSELWTLLYRREVPYMDVNLYGNSGCGTLEQFSRMIRDTAVDCLVLNCGFLTAPQALMRLLDAHTEHPLNISHYFCAAEDYPRHLLRVIGSIVPLLSYENYMAYRIMPDAPQECFDVNAAALRCASGEEYEILFLNDGAAILTKGEGLYRKWESFLSSFPAPPIKSVKDPSAYNYIGFLEHYRRLEERHDVYKFRPDLCINCVPPELLKNAFMEGYEQNGRTAARETVNALLSIQRKRYGYAHSGKQATRMVVSEKALRRFAETGRLSDHEHAMRPFTPEERRLIFEDCIRHANPEKPTGLHIHLLDPADEERIYANAYPLEMICYDERCVQITPAMTDYNFGKGHSEIFIEQEKFRTLFVDFFMNDLIRFHTLPEENTAALFRTLSMSLT